MDEVCLSISHLYNIHKPVARLRLAVRTNVVDGSCQVEWLTDESFRIVQETRFPVSVRGVSFKSLGSITKKFLCSVQ